jgi:putative transposase
MSSDTEKTEKEAAKAEREATAGLKLAIHVDSGPVEDRLRSFIRETVEESLNAALDAEADALCGAKRYEHTPDRLDTRSGSYERKIVTGAGEVTVRVPKLRRLCFESDIIERYRRRQSSLEEALVEMYLAGVSVRRVEDITEALWGTRVSASTVSELNQKVYERIEEWRKQPIEKWYPYVYVDGIWLKRSWGGEVRNVSVLVAIGVDLDGERAVLGVVEGCKEDTEAWLKDPLLIISDKCLGLVEAARQVFPESQWQRCLVHFYRNVFTVVPKHHVRDVMAMLKAIHAQEDRTAAREKAREVVGKLRAKRLEAAARIVEEGIDETLTFMSFPREHWRKIRTNNLLERLNKEIRRRTRVVGAFPDGHSALMLVCARLRHTASHAWSTRKYMDMSLLEPAQMAAGPAA